MNKFETVDGTELSVVVGGKKIKQSKTARCLSELVTKGGIGFMRGSAFGTAWGLAKAGIKYCGWGPQPQKFY